MLIKNKKTKKFDIDMLSKYESRVMILFLQSEKERHQMDIDDIEKIIIYLETKFKGK